MNFSVSSTNQNEYAKIYITGINKNNESKNIAEDYFNYIYVYNENFSDIEYFIITFEFKNYDLKSIISSFCDRVYETYPQIYSTQMFYINHFTKIYHFQLKHSFLGYYQHLGGNSGIPGDLYSADNFKGKLISLPIENGIDVNITVITNEFTYCVQLITNLKIIEIEELKQGKPLIKFMNKASFPLYYYYKIRDKKYVNINANLRFNEDNKFENYNYSVKGYIIDEDTLNKKIDGENIITPTPYEGKYSEAYGITYLQVNKIMAEEDFLKQQYLFIVLEKNGDMQDESNLSLFFIETMVKEYDDINEFFLPKHIYFIDTFDNAKNQIREENRYYIFNPKGNTIQPVIELSSQYNNTIIEFENVNICHNKNFGKKTNYMLIYYLNDIIDNYLIKLNYDKDNFDNKEKETDIMFRFNGINVINSGEIGLIFYITGSLYKSDETSFELINSTCFLHERQQAFVSEKTNSTFYNTPGNDKSTEFTLIFKNIPKEKYNNYDLRIQMKARAFVDFSKEEYLAFTIKADLTNLTKRDLKWLKWAIPVIVVGVVLIIALVFLIIKFLKLRKNNTNLKQDMVSLAFSNDVQKNVLSKEMKISKNESDFESTFI